MFGIFSNNPHQLEHLRSKSSKLLSISQEDWFVNDTISLVNPVVDLGSVHIAGNKAVLSSVVENRSRFSIQFKTCPIQTIAALRGPFALAVVPEASDFLIICRDHFGQSKLFFASLEQSILFSDDITKLVKMLPTIQFDETQALSYLKHGRCSLGRTLIEGVYAVPAAHAVIMTGSLPINTMQYWSPVSSNTVLSDMHEMCTDSVWNRLKASVSDVASPTALLLSGGVDSGLIASALASQQIDVSCRTISFPNLPDYNESNEAEQTAVQFRMPHANVELNSHRALEYLFEVVGNCFEPCAAWASISHAAILDNCAGMGISTLLSGLGADELFGGYDHYLKYQIRLFDEQKKSEHGIHWTDRSAESPLLFQGIAEFFSAKRLRLYIPDTLKDIDTSSTDNQFFTRCQILKSDLQFHNAMVAHECQFRIPEILFTSFEQLNAIFGTRVSYPFLNPEFAELGCNLSLAEFYSNHDGIFVADRNLLDRRYKRALIRLAGEHLPGSIVQRPRKTYTFPFGKWFFERSFSYPILERLRKSKFWETGLLKRKVIDDILDRIQPGPCEEAFELWAILSLSLWFDRFIDQS